MLTCPRSSLSFHSNAHHHGSLPQQLGVVWDLLLKADPEGPILIFHAACPHDWSVHDELLSVCACSPLKPRKLKVSGFPSPFVSRLAAAWRPNSTRRVLSGWSDSANSSSRTRIASRKRRASSSCSKPATRSSAPGSALRAAHRSNPQVEDVVQVDVGKPWRRHRTLPRSPVTDRHDPIFENARPQPLLDQADDALVADPVFDEADEPFLAHRPEEVPDVGVKNVVHLPVGDPHHQGIQRIMWSAPGTEPVREPEEVFLVDGVQHHDGSALDDLVFQGGDRQRPLPSVRLRYVRPAGRLGPV